MKVNPNVELPLPDGAIKLRVDEKGDVWLELKTQGGKPCGLHMDMIGPPGGVVRTYMNRWCAEMKAYYERTLTGP